MNLRSMCIKVLLLALCLGILPSSMYGAACTVTYVWPVAGSTAPTAAQARQHNSVVADIAFLAADTSCVITHNMQLPNATGANGIPKITHFFTAAGVVSFTPFFAFTSATTITVDKNLTTANSTGTLRVVIERPAGAVK